MSSSGSGEQRGVAPAAEQHLGDRLAAFVDGELSGDVRDRVLAHLATCPQCKAAAAEQRRLKSVMADSELPAISAGLLARLQGLPGVAGPGDGAGGADDVDRRRDGGPDRGTPRDEDAGRRGPFDGGLLGSGVFGPDRREEFSYLSPGRDLVAPAGSRARGFRIHEVAPDAAGDDHGGSPAVAAASRGRRFAFAAAGAFSMAAIAIGSALPMEAAVDGGARPDDGPAVSPLIADTVSDTRGVTPRGLLDAGSEQLLRAPAAVPPAAPAGGVMASATSVALTRPLPVPGTVPPTAPAALTPPGGVQPLAQPPAVPAGPSPGPTEGAPTQAVGISHLLP